MARIKISKELIEKQNARFNDLIAKLGMTAPEFLEAMGLAPNFFFQRLNRVNSISNNTMLKIRHKIPNVNPQWLCYGEGDMTTDGKDPVFVDAPSQVVQSYNNKSFNSSSVSDVELLHSTIDKLEAEIVRLHEIIDKLISK